MYYDAAEKVRLEVQRALGFDGTRDRIVLLGALGETAVSGSPFLCPAAQCAVGAEPWMRGAPGPGWSAGKQEGNFLRYAEETHLTFPVSVVLTLWLHNETDVYDRRISAAEWASAVKADARLTRSALHIDPDHSPYMFVWVPAAFSPEVARSKDVGKSAQEIKSGMAMLEHDPDFNALAGPQTGDSDMSNGAPGYGYLHMTRDDASSLVHRISNCVADALQAYAHPGSFVTVHPLDCRGPVAKQAILDHQHPEKVLVSLHVARSDAIRPPGSAAAKGAGWSAVSPDGTETLDAVSANLVATSEVEVSFSKPLSAGWRVYYGYGVGRIAYQGGPGRGAALYDSAGIPMTVPSTGLALAPPLGSGLPVSKAGYDVERGASRP